MGWSLLGDVNDGWFARLAHGVENGGRWVGNKVFGGGAGDQFYDGMARQADQVVGRINDNTINQALANGATQQQALQAGSAAMDRLANPGNVSEMVELAATGTQVAGNTVVDTAKDLLPSLPTGDLSSLLIAGLAIGGTLIACEACSGPSSTPTVRRRDRQAAYA